VESTLPPPYKTPGMAGEADAAADAAKAETDAAEIDANAPRTFTPRGQVYGAPAGASQVTLVARKSVSLVIRGPGGAVLFAQQLKPGEAYRAPADRTGLSVDVSDAGAILPYVNGQLHAPLGGLVTPLSKLAVAPATVPAAPAAPGG